MINDSDLLFKASLVQRRLLGAKWQNAFFLIIESLKKAILIAYPHFTRKSPARTRF